MGQRYQSGRISNGVAKGVDDSIGVLGKWIANPNMEDLKPFITIGNMYRISFGHAGSP